MERVRVAAAVFALLLLVQIIRSVRREHIRVEYSMAWFAAALLLLMLSLSDLALNWVSRALGVEDSSFVLLMVGGVLFLFTFFRFSVQVSEIKDHNIQLAQKVSLLEWEVRRQSEELKRARTASPDDQEEDARGASP